jgi:hypothetical protein
MLSVHAGEKDAAPPAQDSAPMYVDAKAINERFSTITDEDMDMLRSKKILLGTQSFGMNMAAGLRLLAKEDKKYDLISSYHMFSYTDWSDKAGADKGKNFLLTKLPPDVFSQFNFVHFMITIYPWSKRTEEMNALIREEPFHFGKVVDAAMVFFHTCEPKQFDYYSKTFDAMQADYPKVKFIYCAAGVSGPKLAKNNENGFAFAELVRARYKGKAPLYDMGKILSDDYRNGHVVCPEYSNDPADLHPNLPAGEIMMAKGFLLVMRDAFRSQTSWAGQPASATSGEVMPPKVETVPADHPDAKAVRALLDANGLKNINVNDIAVVEGGRIVKLYLKEIGVAKITSDIGELTELKGLHAYGDPKQSMPLLKTVDPAIGKCTKLEELLLNDGELTTLPDTVVNLTKLTHLSVGNNQLHNLSPAVTDWIKQFDPKGLDQQQPATGK